VATINGTSGNDTLTGTSGNDTINGFDGNDHIVDSGGTSAIIDGGAGGDVISVSLVSTSASQGTTILGGSGNDGIDFGMTGPGHAAIDLGAGQDNLILTSSPSGGLTITLGDSADLLSESINFYVDYFKGASFGPLTITDFDPGRSDGYTGLQGDFLAVGDYAAAMLQNIGYDSRISPFDAGMMKLVQDGADTVLQLMQPDGTFADSVTFQNTQVSEFTLENFFTSTQIAAGWTLNSTPGVSIDGDAGADVLTGGLGDDTIDGAAGNDTINGGRGNDSLTGGAGSDTFVMYRTVAGLLERAGSDTVTDFNVTEDRLDLSAYGFRYFEDVLTRAHQDGSDVVIDLTPGEHLRLQNVQLSSLSAGNFVGVEAGAGLAVLPPVEPAQPTEDWITAPDNLDVTVAGAETLYSRWWSVFETSDYMNPIGNLTNDGTIWASSYGTFVIRAYGAGDIVNHGNIYSVASGGDAWGFHFDSGFDSLDNSGTIAVVSWQSRAIGIETYDARSTISNSGTISVRGDFEAYGIAYYSGIEPANESTTPAIANTATGQILAEGPGAVAIYLGEAPIFNADKIAIDNAGLIEARSWSDDASAAIIVGGYGSGGTANILNSGTIIADFAYYTDPTADQFYSTATNLTNASGGQVFGSIVFANRVDTLTNSGTINGDVYTFGGNDLVDTTGGRLNGYVDLGDGADTYRGSAYSDDVFGGAGDDTLTGNAGNDLLDGGTGADSMDGGKGDDTYIVDNASDTVTEVAAAGYDAVFSSINYTLGSNVEELDLLGSAPLNGTGNALDNVLFGNSGNNILAGNGGNDILEGGAGDDSINGGAGFDYAAYSEATAGVNVSLTSAAQSTGGAGTDTLSSIEGLIGSNFNDRLTGNAAANDLAGGGGNDLLEGGGGNDIVDGGAGIDTASYVHAALGVTVSLATSAGQNTGGAGTDRLLSIENLTGSAYSDDLRGNAGANDLSGLAGNDKLTGLAGNDTLDGGAGIDAMRGGLGDDIYYADNVRDNAIENAGEGTDTVFSSASYSLGSNVENLTITGSAVRGNGNSLANAITGNSGDNILNGGAGADTMRGGLGNDTYYIDNAGDRAIEDSGAGRDRVYTTISLTLDSNLDDLFARGSDAINLTGNSLDNTLRGNSAANVLTGGAGADDLRGGTGADTFVFRDGDFAGLTPSTADRIIDFSHSEGDRIDLAQVDANAGLGGDQDFTFIGNTAFHDVAGELRYEIINGNTYVYGDTNGDGLADLMIRLDGSHALVSGDFIVG
jgi:Ca2+-binding RTX toxin-like protein